MQHCKGGSWDGGGAALQHCMGVDHVGWGCNTAALHGGAVGGLQQCSTAWGCCGGIAALQHCMGVLCGEVAALQHRVGMLCGGCSTAAAHGGAVGGLQHCSTALSARSAALHETAAAR